MSVIKIPTTINRNIIYIGFIEKDIKVEENYIFLYLLYYNRSTEKFYDKFRKLITDFFKENIDTFIPYESKDEIKNNDSKSNIEIIEY